MEKTVERAQQMLEDLKAAKIPQSRIAKEAGVNTVTLWQIAKKGQPTVSERVFDAIWDYWSEHAPPKGTDTEPTNDGQTATETPQKASAVPKVVKQAKAKVHKPSMKKRAVSKSVKVPVKAVKSTELPPIDIEGMISHEYVPVDLKALTALIDGMIDHFRGQVEELQAVKTHLNISQQ